MKRRPSLKVWIAVALVAASVASSQFGSAAAPKPTAVVATRQIVVKLAEATGATIGMIERDYALVVVRDVLASRGIYLLEDAQPVKSKATAKALADAMSKDDRFEWAEPNIAIDASDDRFHAWPEGSPVFAGFDQTAWQSQAIVEQLGLAAAHKRTTGKDVKVAVLDTGIDALHPAFDGSVRSLWDFVDDDSDSTDRSNGVDDDGDGFVDEAFGHGTHVAGIVHLIAPDAEILDARVLDADGRGNIFVVAEAIAEASDAGADVINLSFGTVDDSDSKLLADAVKDAQHNGLIVVASAGNQGSAARHMPADLKDVLAVGGLTQDNRMAAFSNGGPSVHLAAPAVSIISPVPGDAYASWSGTSMAAPIVAGEVALLRSIDQRVKSNVIRTLVLSATKKVNPGQGPKTPKVTAEAIDITAAISRFLK